MRTTRPLAFLLSLHSTILRLAMIRRHLIDFINSSEAISSRDSALRQPQPLGD